MEKKIEVCIGTDRAGNVRARLSLLLYDGAELQVEKYHSINLEPGDNAALKRADAEAHLAMPSAQSGIPFGPWPAIPDEEWAKVTTCIPAFHTAKAIEQRIERDAKREAQERAIREAEERARER